MHAQKAWFTIHGDEHIPLEDVPGRKKVLQCVKVLIEALPAARDFLDDGGINIYSVYPDLANLTQHLKQKYGLKTANFGNSKPQKPKVN